MTQTLKKILRVCLVQQQKLVTTRIQHDTHVGSGKKNQLIYIYSDKFDANIIERLGRFFSNLKT